MKKILTLLSALFMVTGLKAQKAIVQKETIMPKVDTVGKSSIVKQINKATDKKDAKIAPAIKYASTLKVATKAAKIALVN